MTLRQVSSFRCQRGVSLIAAIFLLLLFVTLAGLVANVISTSHTTAAEDLQGTQTYQAARGGIEWGLFSVMDPGNATAIAANAELPLCFNNAQLNQAQVGAAVTVTCNCYPTPCANGNYYQEGTKMIRIYRITAIATQTGPVSQQAGGGTPARGNIERRLEVTAEKCRDTASTTFPFDC